MSGSSQEYVDLVLPELCKVLIEYRTSQQRLDQRVSFHVRWNEWDHRADISRYANGLFDASCHVPTRFQPSFQDLPEPWSRVSPILPPLLSRVQADSVSYDERVLPSIGNEVLKATVAQFDGTSSLDHLKWISDWR